MNPCKPPGSGLLWKTQSLTPMEMLGVTCDGNGPRREQQAFTLVPRRLGASGHPGMAQGSASTDLGTSSKTQGPSAMA